MNMEFMRLRKKYYINNHSCFKLDYHLVLVTKYKHNVLVLVNRTKKHLLITLKIRGLKNKKRRNSPPLGKRFFFGRAVSLPWEMIYFPAGPGVSQ